MSFQANTRRANNVEYGQLSMTCNCDIPAFVIVTVDGLVANSNDLTQINKAVGISLTNAKNGSIVPICYYGVVQIPDQGWEKDSLLFLNGTQISTTAPNSGWHQTVGIALSRTSIFINLCDPILL